MFIIKKLIVTPTAGTPNGPTPTSRKDKDGNQSMVEENQSARAQGFYFLLSILVFIHFSLYIFFTTAGRPIGATSRKNKGGNQSMVEENQSESPCNQSVEAQGFYFLLSIFVMIHFPLIINLFYRSISTYECQKKKKRPRGFGNMEHCLKLKVKLIGTSVCIARIRLS